MSRLSFKHKFDSGSHWHVLAPSASFAVGEMEIVGKVDGEDESPAVGDMVIVGGCDCVDAEGIMVDSLSRTSMLRLNSMFSVDSEFASNEVSFTTATPNNSIVKGSGT